MAATVDVYRVLADPTRRRVLELLAARPRTVSELVGEFEVSQPAISQHLAVLRQAHLVVAEVDGARRRYRLTPAPLQEVAEWMEHFSRFWDGALDRLGDHLGGSSRAR